MAKVNPGYHKNIILDHFTPDEKSIIKRLSNEWYISKGGEEIRLGATSIYRYCLMKPVDYFQEMFNIEREVIVVFSPYKTFETRTLDAIDYAAKRQQSLRVERICSVVISMDPIIEARVRDLLKTDPESPLIVPFVYDELLVPIDPYFIRNRFKEYFYTRDLFAFEGPLKKDLYFFGRGDLIHRVVNRHLSNENSALLGLRKTGKTSLIFGIARALSQIEARSVFIDCQNPALHVRRWNKALYYIIEEAKTQHSLNFQGPSEDQYTEADAPIIFEREICKIYEELGKKNILLIFDEVENITFDISPSWHWAEELDFVFFWQTLRSLFQKLPNIFTYLIVGTNPMCLERPTIKDKDNPIFNQVSFEYLPGFDALQTREMVRKLGRIMGLKIDEIIYGKLTDDFGGHPFLMRHVCSIMNQIASQERPTNITKVIYEKAKEEFNRKYASYIEMVLMVLQTFYKDEYTMLEYLARGDTQKFNELASQHISYTNHLLGYGLVEESNGAYTFKLESVRHYLAELQKYQKINLTPVEMWAEISERRNALEPKLRFIVRNHLWAAYGKDDAREKVIRVLGGNARSRYNALSYEDLFDANKTGIYFDDLRKIIKKNWDCFKNIFGPDDAEFENNMKIVNKFRIDAHAQDLHPDKMTLWRVSISDIENSVEKFYR